MKKLFILLAISAIAMSCNNEKEQLRILTCGIRHESNTFSTVPVLAEDFEVFRGDEVLEQGYPWCEYLKEENVEVIPVLHAYAWPGGVVSNDAYMQFRNEILDGIRKAGHLDGIYLDMHGALHVQGIDDAQYDLIKAIREITGDDVVISASFDLHGNISDQFVSGLDLVTAFRTAPHRDGAETKLRAVRNLVRVLREDLDPCMARVEIPILVPGEKSITEVEPLHHIYARLDSLEKVPGIMDASILVGYAWADLPRSAMRVYVVSEDESHLPEAEQIAESLAQEVWDSRKMMVLDVESGDIGSMIHRAQELPQSTVFISDSGDNTTAGAPGDNPQVIKALIDAGVKNALFAGLVDKEVFDQCRAAGIGAELEVSMGGKKDTVFGRPLDLKVKVIDVSDDASMADGRGIVLVESSGVKIALLDRRNSFTELSQFRDINLDPLDFKIVVVKLGYLYPELRDIAPVHLMALTSGFCNLEMTSLPFRHVRRPAYPLDADMDWTPEVYDFR